MSYRAKRELLAQTAPRYQEAGHQQKSVILNEFVAATGYARKYAIRLLTSPVVAPRPAITRSRERRYGPEVQAALRLAWEATNCICAKRLVPFLPELVPVLERHGHLTLADEVRTQLLAISPAPADRVLSPIRRDPALRGISTTRAGTLLKHQIPVRTCTDWDDAQPGFFEIDLVAHCGGNAEGAYLYTLVLTDVATGWTECLPLLNKGQHGVVQAMTQVRQLVPMPLVGIDSDNGKEFLNNELLDYCEREGITFTRGRAYKKNDQCFVEQKNGAIVRHFIGYDRYEGERAYRQLTEVYRALRLYVNFFQPSMKLKEKTRDGSHVQRRYDAAQTPFQRLLTAEVVSDEQQARLAALFAGLDPVRLLRQLDRLQDALWQLAVVPRASEPVHAPTTAPVAFHGAACGFGESVGTGAADLEPPAAEGGAPARQKRKYRQTKPDPVPHTWRTRPDPFADVSTTIAERLEANPELSAKQLFRELQADHPGRFPDVQLRTLQRRVAEWRAKAILTFHDQWLAEDRLQTPPDLRGMVDEPADAGTPEVAHAAD
ncbi:integrase catalytic domain-containing protein [Candidatus Chloroploca asiatica]|uniref:Integrase n=1 Tax=Candidatus Chloroploca asiatica TaxID=1506545 RepID=A0A2H3KMW9_9CHLR|nr:DDE-type integrase/transposase/recombinase [Candidatus Chloroploca asiatica]PDV96486.1 integrase [Candidatus Chloroploca asiatica]